MRRLAWPPAISIYTTTRRRTARHGVEQFVASESSLLQLCLSITSCKSRRRHPAHDCSQFHRLATVLCCSPARRYARIIVIVVIKRSRDSCINRSVYYRAPLNIDAQFLDSDLCSAEWQTGGRSTNSVVIYSATAHLLPYHGRPYIGENGVS